MAKIINSSKLRPYVLDVLETHNISRSSVHEAHLLEDSYQVVSKRMRNASLQLFRSSRISHVNIGKILKRKDSLTSLRKKSLFTKYKESQFHHKRHRQFDSYDT